MRRGPGGELEVHDVEDDLVAVAVDDLRRCAVQCSWQHVRQPDDTEQRRRGVQLLVGAGPALKHVLGLASAGATRPGRSTLAQVGEEPFRALQRDGEHELTALRDYPRGDPVPALQGAGRGPLVTVAGSPPSTRSRARKDCPSRMSLTS